MNRLPLIVFGLGILAIAGLCLMAVFGAEVMPSYFAAWLFWLGLPMGALPLVMAMEAAGAVGSPLLPVLRRMLPLLAVGTLFAIPVLARSVELFARPGLPGALPDWWTAPGSLVPRDVAILLVLSGLALLFCYAPARPRRGLAVLGMLAYLVLASIAAVDWILAPQPGLGSSAVGPLLMLGQAGLAAALAGFVLAIRTPARHRLPSGIGLLTMLLLVGWAFMQFTQFLVVWSANLPAEAAWYLARISGFGTGTVAFAAVATTIGCALLPSRLGRIPTAVATLASLVLLAQLMAALWLITPAFRGAFWLTFADVFAVLGIGGLLVGLLIVLLSREVRHAAA